MVDVRTRRAGDIDDSQRAFLGAKDRVIDDRVWSRHFEDDLHHRGPGGWHQSDADAMRRRIAEIAFTVTFIKDGAYDVEG